MPKPSDAQRILDMHNDLGPKIVQMMIQPIIDGGGKSVDVMILLESVIVGLLYACVKPNKRDYVLDAIVERVKVRVKEFEFIKQPPQGNA